MPIFSPPTPEQKANIAASEAAQKKKKPMTLSESRAASAAKRKAPWEVGAQAGKASVAQMAKQSKAATLRLTQQEKNDIKAMNRGENVGYDPLARREAEKQNLLKQADVLGQKAEQEKLARTQAAQQLAQQPAAQVEKPTVPKFSGFETQEEILQKQNQYYKQLASYNAQQKEQPTEITKNVDLIRQSNIDAINNLNAKFAGLGDKLINQTVSDPKYQDIDLNDGILQDRILTASKNARTEEERNSNIKSILDQYASKEAMQLPTEVPQSIAPSEILPQEAPPAPSTAREIAPVLTDKEIQYEERKDEYKSTQQILNTKVDFNTILNDLQGTDGSTFTSADLLLKKLELSSATNEMAKNKLQEQAQTKKDSILKQKEKYDNYFNDKRQTYSKFILDSRDEALRRNDLQEERILADKKKKEEKLSKKTNRYESFIKAQMAAAGIPLAGQAGATMLINTMSEWTDTVEGVLGEYDNQLADLHNNSIEIIDSYAKNLMDINFQLDEKQMSIDDKLQEKWDSVEDNLLMSEMQIELSQAQAVGEYFEGRSKIEQQKEAQMIEAQEKAQERLWEQQKWYSEQSGMMMEIDPNTGRPAPMTDEEGNPIQLQSSREFMMTYGLSLEEFNLDKQKFDLDSKEFYYSMNELDLKQDLETGEWFGFNKNTGAIIPYGQMDPSGGRLGGIDLTDLASGEQITVGNTTITIGEQYGPKQGNNAECVGTSRLFNPSLPSGLYTLQDKLNISNDKINSATNGKNFVPPGVGSTVFFSTGDSPGHAATVTKMYVNEQGVQVMDIIESNWDNNNTVGVRTGIPVSKAAGFYTDPNSQVIKSAQPKLGKEEKKLFLDLKADFNGRQEVKEWKTIQSAYTKIKAVQPTAAGDMALVFNFMKMLDPGSTVREGEFANAQNAAGVPERIKAKWNNMINGELLEENQRADFLQQTENILEEQRTNLFQPVVNEFIKDANLLGLPKEIADEIIGGQNIANSQIESNPEIQNAQQENFRTAKIQEVKQQLSDSSNEPLTSLTDQIDDKATRKEVESKFEQYFGLNWRNLMIGQVNPVNITDSLYNF